MAGSCEICGIGPIPSPCMIVCWDDCRVCEVSFQSQMTKMVIDTDAWKAGKAPQFDASKKVQFCCNGVTAEQIADFVNKVYPAGRYRSSKADSVISETMSGTLDEIMQKLGFERE
jgi:hypothetical protein